MVIGITEATRALAGPAADLDRATGGALSAVMRARDFTGKANEVAVVRLDDRVRVPTFAVLNGFLLGSQAIAAGVGGLVARSIGVRRTIVLSLLISGAVGLWGTLRPPHEIRHRIGSSTTPR